MLLHLWVSSTRICICILHFNCKWKQLSKLVEILKRRIELVSRSFFRGAWPPDAAQRTGGHKKHSGGCERSMRNALHIFGARPAWKSVKSGSHLSRSAVVSSLLVRLLVLIPLEVFCQCNLFKSNQMFGITLPQDALKATTIYKQQVYFR